MTRKLLLYVTGITQPLLTQYLSEHKTTAYTVTTVLVVGFSWPMSSQFWLCLHQLATGHWHFTDGCCILAHTAATILL